MTLEQFAGKHRLHTRRDECGDTVIPGRRGHLYFDEGELCLMVLDGGVIRRSRWERLGGDLWLGDISEDANGRRGQDVKVAGIPLERAKLAIQLALVRPKRELTEAVQAALVKARKASPLGL